MSPADVPLPLRPHHGMCLAHYVGRGYSAEFTRHMEKIHTLLTRNPPIRLVTQTDAICSACPHRRENHCHSEARVACFDQSVLTACGLHDGDVLPFSRFAALVEQRILTPGRRAEICGDCQWDPLCQAVRNHRQTADIDRLQTVKEPVKAPATEQQGVDRREQKAPFACS